MEVQFGSSYGEFRKPWVREIGIILYIAFNHSYSNQVETITLPWLLSNDSIIEAPRSIRFHLKQVDIQALDAMKELKLVLRQSVVADRGY